MKWKQIQQTSKGTWQAVVVQQKTKKLDCKPVTAQALQLCGERPDDDERLVFVGLTDISWISHPLIESQCDYKTVSAILGHSNVATTLNLYVHPNIHQKKKCIERMNKFLGIAEQ